MRARVREQLLALTAEDSAEVDGMLAPELDDVEVCWSAWWVGVLGRRGGGRRSKAQQA